MAGQHGDEAARHGRPAHVALSFMLLQSRHPSRSHENKGSQAVIITQVNYFTIPITVAVTVNVDHSSTVTATVPVPHTIPVTFTYILLYHAVH
jgi:hypothetical protein